jgi:hypothetical protein
MLIRNVVDISLCLVKNIRQYDPVRASPVKDGFNGGKIEYRRDLHPAEIGIHGGKTDADSSLPPM